MGIKTYEARHFLESARSDVNARDLDGVGGVYEFVVPKPGYPCKSASERSVSLYIGRSEDLYRRIQDHINGAAHQAELAAHLRKKINETKVRVWRSSDGLVDSFVNLVSDGWARMFGGYSVLEKAEAGRIYAHLKSKRRLPRYNTVSHLSIVEHILEAEVSKGLRADAALHWHVDGGGRRR